MSGSLHENLNVKKFFFSNRGQKTHEIFDTALASWINLIFSERGPSNVSPQQRIEDMLRLTELCIDLIKENEEHHGEVCLFQIFYLSHLNYIKRYLIA